MNTLHTPIEEDEINRLMVGDTIYVSGDIYCGRDAVLPKLVQAYEQGSIENLPVCLKGGLIFHSAVSPAGIGPTSSNKSEIERSIIPLSKAGVKIHLGKGRIDKETIKGLNKFGSVYAVTPPVTALLGSKVKSKELIAYPELGIEALYKLTVEEFPMIIAVANGRSIYDRL